MYFPVLIMDITAEQIFSIQRTVGSALEAACAGVHAIAFSEGASECHEVTDAYLEQMLKELMEQPLAHNQIWNVNFPQCELEKLRGIFI